jgi:xanthine dehydrogenase YagS FAD-binding subunit
VHSIEFASPTRKEDVAQVTGQSWADAELLAGGTDLLSLMKDAVVTPKRVVNIKGIADLKGVSSTPNGLRIGALTSLQDVADNANVMRMFPALAEAANDAASPQIRNMATLGGNLCQRPRCWWFRNGFGLLAMKDGKSLVPDGENRNHAILGNEGPAYFVSPSTIAPVLIAYGAMISILGPDGARHVALEKFYITPKTENDREHDLRPGELVTEVIVPNHKGTVKAASYEVRQKTAFDWPLSMASVVLTMSGNSVQSARVVLGHVAPVPWVSQEAAEVLQGKPMTEDQATAAGAAAVRAAKPLSHNGYKVQLTRVAVKRALMKAAGIEPHAG